MSVALRAPGTQGPSIMIGINPARLVRDWSANPRTRALGTYGSLAPRGTALISCLTLTDVMRVAEEATRAHEEFIPVAAVTTTGGSSYAELLLRVRGRIRLTTIGIFRDVSESQLRADIMLALSVRANELGLA